MATRSIRIQKSKVILKKRAVATIRSIFNDFVRYEDGAESDKNKEAMRKSLGSLPYTINKNELPLLINVWKYDAPTDYPTRELIMPILARSKKASLVAIKDRLNHKRKGESNDAAPYSDLVQPERDMRLSDERTF